MRFLTAALLFAAAPAMAQDPQTRTIWGFVALGPGSVGDSGFYASGIGMGIQRNRVLYMARIASLDTKDAKRISDFGVLVGLATRPRRFSCGAALGLAAVRDSRDSTALGIPLEAFVSVIANDNAALGLRLFSDANRLSDFAGLTVSVMIGRVRSR
jgi:hypothetical protein